MASFVPGKMKRKGFDEVYEGFSDLSLCAPATKIRRLDAELPPIIEDRCPIGGSVIEPQLLNGDIDDSVPDVASVMKKAVNEERALVLYKPVHSQFASSLKMDPELLTGLKNPAFWSGYQNLVEEDFVEEHPSSSINSLAVVPWVPSQFSASKSGTIEEIMEVEADDESMEIDGNHEQLVDTGVGAGSFHQWQQHCLIPAHSHLASTPVLGSW